MNGKFFPCDCGMEGLWVEHNTDFGTEIALFSRDPSDRCWPNRIKLAWACLKGTPYKDEVILDDQQLANLVEHLIEIQNPELEDYATEEEWRDFKMNSTFNKF